MIGFLLKKSCFDLFDNLKRFALLNLGFVLSAVLPFLAGLGLNVHPALSFALLAASLFWGGIYLAVTAHAVRAMAEHRNFSLADFRRDLKASLGTGVLVALAGLVLASIGLIFSVYFADTGSAPGLVMSVLGFWGLLVSVLVLQYYLPLQTLVGGKPWDLLRKCFMLFADNSGFSLALILYVLALSLLSVLGLLLIPGPAGILHVLNEGLRLRLLKYSYLETHPEADRRKLPWEEILREEREKAGSLSLRGLLFPWKG